MLIVNKIVRYSYDLNKYFDQQNKILVTNAI